MKCSVMKKTNNKPRRVISAELALDISKQVITSVDGVRVTEMPKWHQMVFVIVQEDKKLGKLPGCVL